MTFLLHLTDIYHQEAAGHQVVGIWNIEIPACDAGHRPKGNSLRKGTLIVHNTAPFTGRIAIIGSVR
jgi:hypothetical protein